MDKLAYVFEDGYIKITHPLRLATLWELIEEHGRIIDVRWNDGERTT